ncbi:MAG: hypothetical protein HFI40_03970 [Lachnospiraceae bacterium]|nr:hypothetical protein [Lachnospiraceae bacterium]
MKRKWLYGLTSLALLSLILLLPFVGRASGSTASGTAGGNQADSGGAPAGSETKIVLDIYRVGGILTDEATGEHRYELVTGGAVTAKPDSVELDRRAQEIARYVLVQDAEKPVALEPIVRGAELGSLKDGEQNDALISKWADFLPAEEQNGIYLLIARGADLEQVSDYTMLVEKDEEETVLVTIAKSAQYTYEFAPLLVFRSDTGETPEGSGGSESNPGNPEGGGTTGSDTGSSGSEVVLKPGRVERYGSLEIVKTLLTYKAPSPATFVFSIEAVQADGMVVYSDVISLTFTEAGQKSVRIDHIPVGSKVSVREVYSGSSYTLVSDAEQVVTIPASGTATAAFVNDYNKRQNEGYGITNHFEYGIDPETGISGWEWIQLEDNTDGSAVQKEAE